MSEYISNKAKNISKSQTLAITAAAKKMKAEGISVVSFTAGEPDCPTPDYIVNAAKNALDCGMTKYTPSSGTVELRKAIAKKLKDDNNLDYDYTQIIVSNGAKHSLFNAMYAIINEGDEVIIPSPYWLTYPELVKICGGKSIFIEAGEEQDYKVTAKMVEKAITPKTKAFILNSPTNPTGAVYTKDEVYEIAKVLEKHNIICISDEIYEKLYYNEKPVSIATYSNKMKDLTIVVNGMSKTYAMTGWRIGYLAANKEIADVIDGVQSHMTSNANSIAQEGARVALSKSTDVEELVKIYDRRRKILTEGINSIDGLYAKESLGAFYLFVNISKVLGKSIDGEVITDSISFCNKLLQHGVVVIPGAPFGADDHIRLSYAVSDEDIVEGVKRIGVFISKLV